MAENINHLKNIRMSIADLAKRPLDYEPFNADAEYANDVKLSRLTTDNLRVPMTLDKEFDESHREIAVMLTGPNGEPNLGVFYVPTEMSRDDGKIHTIEQSKLRSANRGMGVLQGYFDVNLGNPETKYDVKLMDADNNLVAVSRTAKEIGDDFEAQKAAAKSMYKASPEVEALAASMGDYSGTMNADALDSLSKQLASRDKELDSIMSSIIPNMDSHQGITGLGEE